MTTAVTTTRTKAHRKTVRRKTMKTSTRSRTLQRKSRWWYQGQVEQFWRFYSHMIRPGDITGHSDFHLFKEGIKPMWEDDANKMGGRCIIRLRKGLASRCWENLILAMLGEQFMVGEEICGAVVSVRFQEDIISIWNKTAGDRSTTTRIRDTLRRVLNLPPNTLMDYKTHNDSIKAWEDFHGLMNPSGGR
ncbi:eukaryotic translation initiation factor 4E type 2 isoform X4 [Nerophis lumbriciformis]|uniref:eukaryotic translation initiation factor 4E type 2 isoform X4 n=1 Tax=Nerophis lumbriciformis TaxID=546530 RepID=UPI002AE093B2|nr:eukaryotic translation initiation factor 4E type 2-like isoform X4 [Nerophis lumbriciformis]